MHTGTAVSRDRARGSPAGRPRSSQAVEAHRPQHRRRLAELDLAVVDDLDVIAPRIVEVERTGRADAHAGVMQRRPDRLLVVDHEAEVPGLVVGGCERPAESAMNWSPMSMNAIRAPARPRSSNSKKRPYQASAASTSPTSSATWLIPTRRATASRPVSPRRPSWSSTRPCGRAWPPGSRPAPGRSPHPPAWGGPARGPAPPRPRSAWPTPPRAP